MKILVDISHPAHVHFFKNAILKWRERGHSVFIVSRDKDLALELLRLYSFNNCCLSKARRGLFGLFIELIEHETRLYRKVRVIRPDIMLQIGGTYIVHAGRLLNIPAVVFYDTENATLSNAITYPFASAICTPSCYRGNVGKKHVRYNGYHELAYLHPDYFSPDESVLRELKLEPHEKFSILRFVSWEASHDVGERGLSKADKISFVNELKKHGRVFITSEGHLPWELEKHRLKLSPGRIHHLMAFAQLYVGESATMASECAMLGVPAIFISRTGRGYTTEEEEKYGLVFNFRDVEQDKAFFIMVKLLAMKNLREKWESKRLAMLKEKINVTDWIVGFVEHYPMSFQEYRNAEV